MHRKEPWSFAPDHDEPEACLDWNVFDANGQLICVTSEENARRIVACVNACRGLPTNELEERGLVSAVGSEMLELEKQRDEADRRAGAAERKLADEVDTRIRRNDWLHKAKREWGVDSNVSFDVVWDEALELKAERDRLQANQTIEVTKELARLSEQLVRPPQNWEHDFSQWWEEHGQYCRAGGGSYEKTFAYRAWESALIGLLGCKLPIPDNMEDDGGSRAGS